jgi:hypothetical protein
MTWLGLVGLAVVITAFAAVTGIKPKGTVHLAYTRMMKMARLAFLMLVVILGVAYVPGRARSHG